MCIEVKPTDKLAFISEELCIGCGICVKKCPFEVIWRSGNVAYRLTEFF